MVQPDSSSSATATRVASTRSSGVSAAQTGYRSVSQPNNVLSATGAQARVRVWYQWWWVLIRPGMITRPDTSNRSAGTAGVAPAGSSSVISLPVTTTPPRASDSLSTASGSASQRLRCSDMAFLFSGGFRPIIGRTRGRTRPRRRNAACGAPR